MLLAAIALHEHQNAASINPGSLDAPEPVELQADVHRDILPWSTGSATAAATPTNALTQLETRARTATRLNLHGATHTLFVA